MVHKLGCTIGRILLLGCMTLVGAACSAGEPDIDSGADEVNSGGLTTMEAVARAKTWSDVKLKYCWAPNGGNNHAAGNFACEKICSRKSNPKWDSYRSDCSGLVSFAWGMPAPGRSTLMFAPFQKDASEIIQAKDLRPGDAVNNHHHIMLFKEWITPGRKATFIEEPGCSSPTPHAKETTSDVTISGTTITPVGRDSFTAIRNPKLTVGDATAPKNPKEPAKPTNPKEPTEPIATPPAGGALDAVACDGIKGWAMGSKNAAVDVELSFFGARAAPGAKSVQTAANVRRDDLPEARADFGFELAIPLSARDGKAHPVSAYSVDSSGAAKLITNGTKTFTCAPPAFPMAPEGGSRRLLAADVIERWRLTQLQDVAKEPQAATATYVKGPDFPHEPLAVQADDNSKEIFVIDGTLRRPIDAAGLEAWKLVPSKRPAADLAKLTKGPAWPATRFIFQGDGPEIFVLDAKVPAGAGEAPNPALAPKANPTGGEDGQSDDASKTAPGAQEEEKDTKTIKKGPESSADSSGCSQHGGSTGASGVGVLFAIALVAARGRRRSRARNAL